MSRPRRWLADLGLGSRLAVSGGREGLVRTALTALGVGLGVAVLLLAVAIPGILDGRHARVDGRDDMRFGDKPPATDSTVLSLPVDSVYHQRQVNGRWVRAEGAHPVLPPGVAALPPAGSIVISPGLRALFDSPDGALLRERFPQPIAGVIGKQGLSGPNELYFYGTDPNLSADGYGVMRLTRYGSSSANDPLSPVLLLLVIVIFVALITPVALFVAAATRFGGEQRDRRLAAVRLVGADIWMTRRIAAGEAVVSAGLGVLVGGVLFLAGRQFAERFELAGLSVFASDITPAPALAALIAVVVPLAALAMTLLAMRRVVIEPLGVVRKAVARVRRRIWWRALLPLIGLALLVPQMRTRPERVDLWPTAGGITLLLLGVATLVPWVCERIVARLGRRGGVSWQIAIRRLQLGGDGALRAVNAVAVAAAGTIALQMLFAAAQAQNTTPTSQDTSVAQAVVSTPLSLRSQADLDAGLRAGPGVTGVRSYRQTYVHPSDNDQDYFEVVVADCATLRLLAELPSCADGDAFGVDPASFSNPAMSNGNVLTRAGQSVRLEDSEERWTVPANLHKAREHRDPYGMDHDGLLLTPAAALPTIESQHVYAFVSLDPADRDAAERLRNAAMRLGPQATVSLLRETDVDTTFSSIRRGLYAGTAVILVLVGLSLLVGTLEQLRDRRRTLAALVAFGTRRGTMAWSILWQTLVPVALGLAVAAVLGLGLGAALLRIVQVPISLDWPGVGIVSGIAAAVVLLVTVASLPPLFRLMRPEGLRFE